MDPNVVLPLASSLLSFAFFVLLIDQWRTRRRPYQLIWAIGMLWYALSAGTEFLGGAFGWSEPLYRAWYLIGAVWVAAWLGLGTVYLLARTRFGYSFAVALGLAGLFTFLSWRKYDYPNSGFAPFLYLGIAVGNILGVVSPQRVIFGGGVSRAGDLLLRPIVQTVNERVHVIPLTKVQFVLAELGINGGLVGAALWARRRCEES
jgi:hypothetical protein